MFAQRLGDSLRGVATVTQVQDRTSWSSLSSYMECGERWRLERVYHLDRATWFATVAGTAIHRGVELMETTGEMVPFKTLFDEELALKKEQGVEVKPSGRYLKTMGKSGGPNKKDYNWWLHYGPQQLEAWVDWRAESDWEVLRDHDGKPMVEVEVKLLLGETVWRGYIDLVMVDGNGNVVVVDLKTGKRPPSPLQLVSYRMALLERGLDARFGAFFIPHERDMEQGRDGLGEVYALTHYSLDYLRDVYLQAQRGIEAGIFLPNVTDMCRGCSVRDHCRAAGGVVVRPGVVGSPVPPTERVELVPYSERTGTE